MNYSQTDLSKTIFLAHASEDKAFVKTVYRQLRAAGLEPWLDVENLRGGERWEEVIRLVISQARFFLAFFTPRSVSKTGFIQKELRLALEELERKPPDTVFFIPLLVDGAELPNIVVGTIRLKDYHAINLSANGGMEKLKAYLIEQIEPEKPEVKPRISESTTVEEAIANGQLEDAFDLISKALVPNNQHNVNRLIVLKGRFHRLKEQFSLGTINEEFYFLENNKVSLGLLELWKSK